MSVNEPHLKIIKETVAKKIAGDILFSKNIGLAMRKWREFFDIRQSKLATLLNVSPSVISDYESGRRKSPGSLVLRRFIKTLIEVDEKRGGNTIRLLAKTTGFSTTLLGVIDIKEFSTPLKISDLIERVNGEIITGEDRMDEFLYGYTVIDSIKAIKELSGYSEFMQLFGMTTERALIFTGVSTGRSPLIALKIVNIKPGAVVLHGFKDKSQKVDPLAIQLAGLMRIPLIVSRLKKVDDIIRGLRKEVK